MEGSEEKCIFIIYKDNNIKANNHDVGDNDEELEDEVTKQIEKKLSEDKYTLVSQLFNIANIGLYIFDYVMDILVVYWLSQEPEVEADWIGWTSAIIVVPLIFVNIFSIVWYHEDHTGVVIE